MHTTSEEVRVARGEALREVIRRLRAAGEHNANKTLDDLLSFAGLNAVLRKMLIGDRSHLKRIAFPLPGADTAAINAGLAAGNTLTSLLALASEGVFEFEGRLYPAQALRDADGQFRRAKNGTIKTVYSARRLTDDVRRAMQSARST